jgi:hypothetical protein
MTEHDQQRHRTAIPRGIEVLVKKAAVDAEFFRQLLDRRGDAAEDIALYLEPDERALLNSISREQLAAIVARTTVPSEHRRVFLGRVAAAMLAVLGAGLAGCRPAKTRGISPDRPPRNDDSARDAHSGT